MYSKATGLFALDDSFSALTVTTGARVLKPDGFMHGIGTCMVMRGVGE